MPLNACELEIDLFCHGMRVPGNVSIEGARGVARTRAGLGSGLEVALPSGSLLKREIWVNVPVVERFVTSSPYRLARADRACATRSWTTGTACGIRCGCHASRRGTRVRGPATCR